MKTIGGNVCIRNGNDLDYCWRECIESLLPVCDEVVVCDGESTDGTQEEVREWCRREPKLKLCVYPWPNPVADIEFWVKWLNFAREHVKADLHLQLDADEILSERSYAEVLAHAGDGRHSVWCKRLNFWQDHRHLIPPGVHLSHRVVRMAPQDVWMPSDGPHPRGAEAVSMAVETGIEIFHYGFLRERKAFFKKERGLHEMFFNTWDPRLTEVETRNGNWMSEIKNLEWLPDLRTYEGYHPQLIHDWLKKRGYEVS